jgi:hypothetical protein
VVPQILGNGEGITHPLLVGLHVGHLSLEVTLYSCLDDAQCAGCGIWVPTSAL